MKIAFLALVLWLAAAGTTFADDLAMAATAPEVVHSLQKGIVKSVSWADPSKGTKSEIVLINSAKNASPKTINVYITSTTTFWDTDAKAIVPEKVVPRTKVNVIYLTTPEGINIAKSIKILK